MQARIARRTAMMGGLALSLAACDFGMSRFNPLGLFGRSEETQIVRVEEGQDEAEITDPRPLVNQVTALNAEPTAGGVLVEARGLPQRQGFYGVDLVEENGGDPVDGALVFSFRVIDQGSTRQGPPQSREVVAGTFISQQRLAGIREIRVQGLQNARSVRR